MTPAERRRMALRRIAAEDPRLAARLILMTLPAAASRIPGTLAYMLDIEGVGAYRVAVSEGRARVEEATHADGDGGVDFELATDPRTLVRLVTGVAGPLGLMLRGRLRIRGKRRRALRLRAMAGESGGRLDPDVMYRALPYLVDPEWTRGHEFTLRYDVGGAGTWYVQARDGERLAVGTEPPEGVELTAIVRVDGDAYERMATGELTPTEALQRRLTQIDGQISPVTLLGRWIDRAQGNDDAELEREERQRHVQAERAAGWSGDADGLLDPRQLYALWERQNWRSHELDFTVDREQW